MIAFRIKQRAGITFVAIGEWNHVFKGGFSRLIAGEPQLVLKRRINDMGAEMAKRVIYVDAFLSEILADSHAARNGYLHTRALRDAIFRKTPWAEGFFYPSVKDKIGMNLAIKPDAFDANAQVCMSQVLEVTRVREFDFFDIEHRRHSKWLDDHGMFLWLPEHEKHECVVFGMTEEEERFCRARGDVIKGNDIMDFFDVGCAPVDPETNHVARAQA